MRKWLVRHKRRLNFFSFLPLSFIDSLLVKMRGAYLYITLSQEINKWEIWKFESWDPQVIKIVFSLKIGFRGQTKSRHHMLQWNILDLRRIGRYMYQSNEFRFVLMGSGQFKPIPLGLVLNQFILLIFLKSNINKPKLPYTYIP